MCPMPASASRRADSNSSVQSSSKALLDEDEDSSLLIQNVRLFSFSLSSGRKLRSRLEKCLDLLTRYLPARLFHKDKSVQLAFSFLFVQSLCVNVFFKAF